jgi:pectin methylesterase-like acyl-CoA thioesterase
MPIINITTGVTYSTVSAAISASSSGDTIDLTAGLYVEEFPLITHSLTIEGVGGFAHLMTPVPVPANNRAILRRRQRQRRPHRPQSRTLRRP